MEEQEHGTNRMCSECRHGRKCLTSWCVTSERDRLKRQRDALFAALVALFEFPQDGSVVPVGKLPDALNVQVYEALEGTRGEMERFEQAGG